MGSESCRHSTGLLGRACSAQGRDRMMALVSGPRRSRPVSAPRAGRGRLQPRSPLCAAEPAWRPEEKGPRPDETGKAFGVRSWRQTASLRRFSCSCTHAETGETEEADDFRTTPPPDGYNRRAGAVAGSEDAVRLAGTELAAFAGLAGLGALKASVQSLG
jgi:hypothetical protein